MKTNVFLGFQIFLDHPLCLLDTEFLPATSSLTLLPFTSFTLPRCCRARWISPCNSQLTTPRSSSSCSMRFGEPASFRSCLTCALLNTTIEPFRTLTPLTITRYSLTWALTNTLANTGGTTDNSRLLFSFLLELTCLPNVSKFAMNISHTDRIKCVLSITSLIYFHHCCLNTSECMPNITSRSSHNSVNDRDRSSPSSDNQRALVTRRDASSADLPGLRRQTWKHLGSSKIVTTPFSTCPGLFVSPKTPLIWRFLSQIVASG